MKQEGVHLGLGRGQDHICTYKFTSWNLFLLSISLALKSWLLYQHKVSNLFLKPKDDLYTLLHPTMHCWTPTSDLYIGCEEGHLLMINGENLKATVLSKMEDGTPNSKKLLCFIFPEVLTLVMVLHLTVDVLFPVFLFLETSLILLSSFSSNSLPALADLPCS